MEIKVLATLFAIPYLAACSTIGIGPSQNSGQIEYRIAEPAAVTRATIEAQRGDGPLAPGRLVRRYSGTREAFDSLETNDAYKDVFSIALEQAIVGGFIGEGRFAQPGEIAILANAFEFDGADASAASSRFFEFPEINGPRTTADGTASAAREGLKLIYFSPDVYLNQPLNFSSLPIVPPSQYSGRPIGIQIVFLELDRMSGPLKSLMRELADLGQASNVANAIPGVGNVALELGSSLLDGNTNNDDIVFEYRMVLYPRHLTAPSDNGSSVNEMATFQPGRYVLRRIEDRSDQVSWKNLALDHNTGRLYNGMQNDSEEVRDDTYVVLNIVKHPPGTPEASYAFQSLAELDLALEAASRTDGSESLQAITDNIAARVADTRSTAWLGEVEGRWSQLRLSLADFELHRYPGSDTKTKLADEATESDNEAKCQFQPSQTMRPDWVQGRLIVSQAAARFVEQFVRADQAKINDGEADSQFRSDDRTSLIGRLSIFAVPKNEPLSASFQTIEAFEAAYIDGKDGSELAAALLSAVENTPRTFSCADLEARGWFEPLPEPLEGSLSGTSQAM